MMIIQKISGVIILKAKRATLATKTMVPIIPIVFSFSLSIF